MMTAMPWPLRLFLSLFVLIFVSLAPVDPVAAQNPVADLASAPFLLNAEKIVYDYELGVVTASGDVEISSEDRVLLADSVSYNQRDGIVSAHGNIVLLEPTGEVAFAEYMQLDSDLKTGFIESLRIVLTDKSQFAANGARRVSADRTVLAKAVYSPCEICEEEPQRPPLWQIKANRIIHRRDRQEIEYQDAFLEVYGVPVAYTPFFRHPDPTVRRRSGFLSPKFGSTTQLGATVQVPYFWAISPHRDLTFEPIFTSDEGIVAAGEYRAALDAGSYGFYASGTHVHKRNDLNQQLDDKEFRGHIQGEGKFRVDPTWQWGFDLQRSTDDTYLKRYRISDADVLTSSLFLEGIHERNYAAASAYTFQGLEASDRAGTTPIVAPLLDYGWVGSPAGRTTYEINANAVSLYRTDGQDTKRISLDGEIRHPFIGRWGDVYTLIAHLGTDLYALNDFNPAGTPAGNTDNATEARVFPVAALDWRYPLVKQADRARLLIEPVAQFIAAPYGGNPSEIPNEDSQSVEFDDTNLFSLNRFPGRDRIESGPRSNIGVKLAAYGAGGGYTAATIGQVYRLKDDDTFARQSGLDDNRSDIVAGVTVAPSEFLDLTYRARLESDEMNLQRNEVYLSLGPDWLRFVTNYAKLDRDLTVDELQEREEIFNSVRWEFARFWALTAHSRRDLTGDGRQIRAGGGLEYQDECIGFYFTYERDFTRDRDIEPSTSINFRIVLKHLG